MTRTSVVADGAGSVSPTLVYAGPLSGPFAWVGHGLLPAVELGCIDGDGSYRVVAVDTSGSDPSAAAQSVLAAHDVVGVVGPTFSSSFDVLGNTFDTAGVPFLTPVATKTSLSHHGWEHFFRMVAPDHLRSRTVTELLTHRLEARRLGVVSDEQGAGLAAAVAAAAAGDEASAEVVRTEPVSRGRAAFGPVAEHFVRSNVDGVFFAGEVDEAVDLRRALDAAGLGEVPFVADDGVYNDRFLEAAGDLANGVRVVFPGAGPESVAGFRHRFGEHVHRQPGPFAVEAYLAARLLVEAARHRSGSDGSLPEVLRSGVAVAGRTVSFDEHGELVDARLYSHLVVDGRWVQERELDATLGGPAR